ncbi:MAG: GGDEF domain-containing protein [Proteobacteria bacterium]|nr:GGDEF domain-containing protein [Pseudomonadota bacterium]
MNARLQALGDVLLGSERRLRIRSARCLLACALMAYSVASLGYFVAVGLAERGPVLALALLGMGGMLLFYAAIRSGASERLRDPSLTIAQMSFALLVGALAYTLAGRGRGAVFPIMMVVLMFGLYSLTPRQVRLMSALALALFGAAMALMAWRDPRVYRPEVEFAHFLVIAIILPAVSMLAGQLGQLRDALKRQKAELREALARNEALAQRDELTGLANRRHMAALIEAERVRSERSGARFCLAVLDIDRFKRINDSHGHPTGDHVLKVFAAEALAAIREADVLARWGGEEFMLMLPDAGLTAARLGLERLRTRVEGLRVVHEGRELAFTVSAGLVEVSPDETLVEAIARADRALYQAKQQGRNKVVADARSP